MGLHHVGPAPHSVPYGSTYEPKKERLHKINPAWPAKAVAQPTHVHTP